MRTISINEMAMCNGGACGDGTGVAFVALGAGAYGGPAVAPFALLVAIGGLVYDAAVC